MDIPLAGAAKRPHIHHFAECIHNTSNCDGGGVELCNYSAATRLFSTMRREVFSTIRNVWRKSLSLACVRHSVTSSHRWQPKARLWIMHADIQRCSLHAFLMLIFRYYVPGRLQWPRNLCIEPNAECQTYNYCPLLYGRSCMERHYVLLRCFYRTPSTDVHIHIQYTERN